MFVLFVYFINLLVLVCQDYYDVLSPLVMCMYIYIIVSFVVFKGVAVSFLQYNFTSMKQVFLINLRKLIVSLKAFYGFHRKTLTLFKVSTDLRWQPLFKKTSYFGLYRSNRTKWFNKTEENFK